MGTKVESLTCIGSDLRLLQMVAGDDEAGTLGFWQQLKKLQKADASWVQVHDILQHLAGIGKKALCYTSAIGQLCCMFAVLS